jgi:hypothetical protein
VTNCNKMFDVGCPRQILGRTTTSLARRITVALPRGLHKAMCSSNGRGLAAFFGSMVFVCLSFSFLVPLLIPSYIVAGSGKTVLSCVLPTILFRTTHVIYQVIDHRRNSRHASNGIGRNLHILFRLPGWWKAGDPPPAFVHPYPAVRPI